MKFKLATMAAAMLGAATAAQAADLGRPAPVAVDYVKVCDAYGAGFFYIPGSETCLKISGYVRADFRTGDGNKNGLVRVLTWDKNARGANATYFRARGLLDIDARTNTEFGLLRSMIEVYWTTNTGNNGAVATSLDLAFVQWGGLTAGRAQSFYDFFTGYAYGMVYHQNWSDFKTNLLAYTFSFGNGVSATLSLEDSTTAGRRWGPGVIELNGNGVPTAWGVNYGGERIPDVVANVNVSQAWGSAQLMAALHQVYTNFGAVTTPAGTFTGKNYDKYGWAIGAGVEVKLPMLGAGDKVALQAAYSEGAISYVNGNAFRSLNVGVDAVAVGRNANNLKLTSAWSVGAGLVHNFSPAWQFDLDGGYTNVDGVGARDYAEWSVAADLRWKPVAGLAIGAALEYRNVDFTSGTTKSYGLKDSDGWLAGLRVQRSF